MNKPKLIPASLRPGDTVGIVAPAGVLPDRALIEPGIRFLSEKGLRVQLPTDLWPGCDFLADTDEKRLAEFHQAFADPEVKALIALRGGYGCLRLLEHLDLECIKKHPKWFIGFSDISLLQNYLYSRTNLLCLHGPTFTSLANIDTESRERLYRSLCGAWDQAIDTSNVRIVQAESQTVRGILVGGNLASLVSLLGTQFDLCWKKKIVFLEDVHEPRYKLDKMLTQLAVAGKLRNVSGVLLGCFSPPAPDAADEKRQQAYTGFVCQRLVELLGDRSIPIWANMPCGHCRQNYVLPIGSNTTMDGPNKRLLFSG
ncbi:MAG: LD-carboxypeptidase [Deltaproteobacteria bacterium]|nr:MAG: LD-carboxypeptidase [Deltaproteobacteria bacterium]